MPRLIEHQTVVIVTVLSGEPPLSRREILAAHAHLDIGPDDFDEMIALLQRAISEAGVPRFPSFVGVRAEAQLAVQPTAKPTLPRPVLPASVQPASASLPCGS